MSRPSLAVVLAEDARQQRFVRHFLYEYGLSRHEIRMEPLPSGKGSGEQWVRQRYPSAVSAYRARSARAKTALMVAIDADTEGPDRRRRQLGDALIEHGLSERTGGEAIVVLIPKRSIETWALFLHGRQVDEDTDYSQQHDVDRLVSGAGVQFYRMTRNPGPPPNCIPSLSASIPEVMRLE